MMEIRKYFKLINNENITYQKLWDVANFFLQQSLEEKLQF